MYILFNVYIRNTVIFNIVIFPNKYLIINKKPSAELWSGQNDEDDLGITYEKIDEYILKGTTGNKDDDNFIKNKHEKTKHKLNTIPIFNE